ncbi:hypothetical protein C8Q70DRAFT_931799 [Cubamyces menziesii]|nr:hypothetical protein C8Q70DRAFT_931799 [Cubamyces menziesii]
MTVLHAALLAFMMFATFAHTSTMNVVAAAAACPVTVRSCLFTQAPSNWTIGHYSVGRPIARDGIQCQRIVPENIDILLDPAKDRDGSSILPWLPELPVCQTATTLFLGMPRVRPARPSSAVISASHDGSGSGTSSSHLLSVLRSCSLWELISLARGFRASSSPTASEGKGSGDGAGSPEMARCRTTHVVVRLDGVGSARTSLCAW